MEDSKREIYKRGFRKEMEPWVQEKVEAMKDAARLARQAVDPIVLLDLVLVSPCWSPGVRARTTLREMSLKYIRKSFVRSFVT